MKPITDRLRVFAFAIVMAFLAIINPSKTLQVVKEILDE